MKYWLDTEFIEDGHTIDLLSIGIVAEDGRELYLQNVQATLHKANDWVRENVLPHLHGVVAKAVCYDTQHMGPTRCTANCPVFKKAGIGRKLLEFCDPEKYGKPEFWGYYADYDWVAICQLFGTMMDLPKGWPMYCRDIKQWADDLGNPQLPEQGKGEHHALADARWNRQAWEFLQVLPAT